MHMHMHMWHMHVTSWNLVLALSVDGGPNHLKNLCDANIIIDTDHRVRTLACTHG